MFSESFCFGVFRNRGYDSLSERGIIAILCENINYHLRLSFSAIVILREMDVKINVRAMIIR